MLIMFYAVELVTSAVEVSPGTVRNLYEPGAI